MDSVKLPSLWKKCGTVTLQNVINLCLCGRTSIEFNIIWQFQSASYSARFCQHILLLKKHLSLAMLEPCFNYLHWVFSTCAAAVKCHTVIHQCDDVFILVIWDHWLYVVCIGKQRNTVSPHARGVWDINNVALFITINKQL